MFILHNAIHSEEIAQAMQEHYGDYGKFTADKGRIEFTPCPTMRPLDVAIITEIKNTAFGYRLAMDKLAALRAERDEAVSLLKKYISNFDDEEIENRQLKNWLDDYWIPALRDFLVKVKA